MVDIFDLVNRTYDIETVYITYDNCMQVLGNYPKTVKSMAFFIFVLMIYVLVLEYKLRKK